MNFQTNQTAAVDTTVANTEEVLYGEFAGGMIHVPTGSSITSLTFHATYEKGGTYLPAFHSVDEHVTPITYVATVMTVAAGGAYPIPVELVGAVAIKAVGDAAGTVYFALKSS